jgi:Holliday junction resolvase
VSASNKAKGSRWERELEDYLNACGVHARRLPRAGAKDIGDVSITVGDFVIVVEAKNVKTADMADFLRQADVESDHYEAKYGVPTVPVVVTKTRQKGAGEGRVTMTVDTLLDLLRLAGAVR